MSMVKASTLEIEMAKKQAFEIIWHNPTTRVVHVTGHSVMDCFQRIYLSTTIKPYKLQLDTLTSIGPYFGKNRRHIYLPRAFQPCSPISKSDIRLLIK